MTARMIISFSCVTLTTKHRKEGNAGKATFGSSLIQQQQNKQSSEDAVLCIPLRLL